MFTISMMCNSTLCCQSKIQALPSTLENFGQVFQVTSDMVDVWTTWSHLKESTFHRLFGIFFNTKSPLKHVYLNINIEALKNHELQIKIIHPFILRSPCFRGFFLFCRGVKTKVQLKKLSRKINEFWIFFSYQNPKYLS